MTDNVPEHPKPKRLISQPHRANCPFVPFVPEEQEQKDSQMYKQTNKVFFIFIKGAGQMDKTRKTLQAI